MIARELISEEIRPLHSQADGEQALQLMQKFGISHLPVCNDLEYLGLISEEEIIKHSIESPLESYLYTLDPVSCKYSDHLFDVMKKISEEGLTLLPVLNDKNEYSGVVVRNDLFEYFNKSFAWSEPGSILVIHLADSQYSLSEISHIIEGEHAMILSSIISRPSATTIVLTIKVNKIDISRIVAALRRFDYEVTASYTEEEVMDNFKDRIDAFMRYLDV
ncbi:MAG: CBS domain-containing protein [Saprospiraceae bacterium]